MTFRPRLTYASVTATAALFVALGGGAYAATQLPKNSVGTKQLKKNAVNGTDVKDNSLTGGDVNESKLGLVPSAFNALNATNATNAQNAANSANATQLGGEPASSYAQRGELQPEALHAVGPATVNCEPATFCETPATLSQWDNYGNGYASVGFRKDAGGFVHLQGIAQRTGGASATVFVLPVGYRPTDATHKFIAQHCGSGSTFVDIGTDGLVNSGGVCLSLDGITFHP